MCITLVRHQRFHCYLNGRYFIQLYQDASVARDKLDLVGTELETLVRSSLSSVADAARHSVTWHIGPLKTVDRSLEKTMDGCVSTFPPPRFIFTF